MSAKKIDKGLQSQGVRKKATKKKSVVRKKKGMTVKDKIFAEDYLINGFNKSKAARTAGVSLASCREMGYKMYNKPHVKEYIEKVLQERVISSAENIKLINDIALSNLTDYYTPVEVVKSKKIKVGLQFLIDQVQDEIDFENEYRSQITLSDEQLAEFEASQRHREQRKLRLQIELKRNPNATRIINSEEELVTEMRLDMNALVADKERGKVKSVTYGKDGLKVEMYSAAEAQDKIAKMRGDYEKDNEQKKAVINVEIK